MQKTWKKAGICAAGLLLMTLGGCGQATGAAHVEDQVAAVDQVLAGRAAEEDGAAEKAGMILTPEAYREQADAEPDEVDADILALVRQIADENDVSTSETEEALSDAGGAADWRTLGLTDDGDGFAMAEMPEDCDVDVDLTILNSTMVYSEVYNMMYYPEKYLGKSVRMRGTYSFYQDEETHKIYLACFIADAAACCQQGIEFEPRGMDSMRYPEDYPGENDEITVVGVYDTYEEDGLTYCTLRDAVLEETL